MYVRVYTNRVHSIYILQNSPFKQFIHSSKNENTFLLKYIFTDYVFPWALRYLQTHLMSAIVQVLTYISAHIILLYKPPQPAVTADLTLYTCRAGT